jgi:hypothetical protein
MTFYSDVSSKNRVSQEVMRVTRGSRLHPTYVMGGVFQGSKNGLRGWRGNNVLKTLALTLAQRQLHIRLLYQLRDVQKRALIGMLWATPLVNLWFSEHHTVR